MIWLLIPLLILLLCIPDTKYGGYIGQDVKQGQRTYSDVDFADYAKFAAGKLIGQPL